ncbi:MAG: hypothetical protein RLZZ09_1566 [Pseudomonadota bacterium]
MIREQKSLVLIVDDSVAARETLIDALEGQGYELYQAGGGAEALALADGLKPDVILLDVMMPEMDGFEVCRRLRADTELAEAPVLMVTALDDRASRLKGIEAGADDFIAKPIDRIEMRARVRTITRLNRYRKLREEHTRLERALEELSETHEATLAGWVAALDLRDKETEGHSERVVALTVAMGRELGLDEDAMLHLRRGALLHDIGKLGVPDAILLKPGKHTAAEWNIMKQHPVFAHEWMKRIPYLAKTAEIPYAHHEKWDGSGYPLGLRGDAIPLSARLFAFADIYDALTSDRPYRPAWSKERTLEYIRLLSGTQLDPKLLDVFINALWTLEANSETQGG